MRTIRIEEEFRGAVLGDRRRAARLERIGLALATEPGVSFPEAMASEGQLEALYRFLNNDGIDFAGIHGVHALRTAQRCREAARVLILHDTTALKFNGHREGIGRLQTSAMGFFFHASLAITPDRSPLGVLAGEPWARKPRDNTSRDRNNKRHVRKDPNRESERWWRGVASAEEVLDARQHAVHIMDREGDNYDLFSQLQGHSIRFVIRLAHNRNLLGATEKLKDVASKGKCLFEREVRVAARRTPLPYDQKIHPLREARDAKLSVSAMPVSLRRSNNYAPGSPPSLAVNVVTVMEVHCPPGVEPISWYLVTGEPIDTQEQVAFIVDAYRARWVIEEFFKALKTGCQIEKRQLESYHSLSNALAVFLPLAVRLLAIRSAGRVSPDAPSRGLSKGQMKLLRLRTTRPLSRRPTNEQVCFALAELGGHLRSNGPPGWIVLGRALERLILLELGWNLAHESAVGNVIDD